jgi:hypothetical protein
VLSAAKQKRRDRVAVMRASKRWEDNGDYTKNAYGSILLNPFGSNAGNYEFWDKVVQIVGNLMKLQTFNIHFVTYTESEADVDYNDEANIADLEILARITRSF